MRQRNLPKHLRQKNHCKTERDRSTWDHFAVEIPQRFIVNSYDVSTKMAEWRDSANVFKRSLEELTMNAVDTVLELIAQNTQ